MLLHSVSDIVKRRSFAQSFDCLEETFFGDADELLSRFGNLSDTERSRPVAVKSVFIRAQVYADNVALLYDSAVGNSVNDNFVYGNTRRRGIPVITEAGRLCAACLDNVIFEGIDVFGGLSRANALAVKVLAIAYDCARLAKASNFFFAFDVNHNQPIFSSRSFAISAKSTSAGASEPVKFKMIPFLV